MTAVLAQTRYTLAAVVLAGAATFTLLAGGGVATTPSEAPVVSSISQTVATGLAGVRDLPLFGRSER